MHGRKRSLMRKQMSERVAKMEMLREQNRIGEIFCMINLKDKPSIDLSSLTVGDKVITDPKTIHTELTRHFNQWYSIPSDLHSEALKFREPTYWRELLSGSHSFSEESSESFRNLKLLKINRCRYRRL